MLEGQDDDEDIPGISEPDIEVLAPENNKVENTRKAKNRIN